MKARFKESLMGDNKMWTVFLAQLMALIGTVFIGYIVALILEMRYLESWHVSIV
jgi:hypothetical protein